MKRFYVLPLFLFVSVYLSAQIPVTFRVDMSDETVSSLGVHVAGDFQGWSPGATACEDLGDGIWGVTVDVFAGGPVTYKFVNGNDWGMNECGDGTSLCGDCGVDDGNGGHNRQAEIPATATEWDLPTYKYNSCELVFGATSTTEPSSSIRKMKVVPNPFTTETMIFIDNPFNVSHDLTVTTITGQVAWVMTDIRGNQIKIERKTLEAGIYFATLQNEKGEVITTKLVVK